MIPRLEDLSFPARVTLTMAVVVIVIILLAFIGWVTGRWEAQAQSIEPPLVLTLPPTKWDAKLLELDKEALDKAYIAKIQQLFDVYVREGLATSEGVMKGHANAQRAWLQGQRAIEIKEQTLEQRMQK